ncbi:MAG: hypothetical protein V3R73_01730 [Sphingomonadales bacterium]
MNMQRFAMAAVAVFVVFGVVYMGAQFVFADQFAALSQAHGMGEEPGPSTWVGRVIYTLVFCYIFVQGHENKGIGEGLRYGVLIGLLLLGLNLDWFGFATIAMGDAAAGWFVDFVASIAAGATIAAIYKPAEEVPSAVM